MQIMNQTRPNIANAVLAIARFSPDPRPLHCMPAEKIPEYLNATWDVGLRSGRDDDFGY